MMTPKKKKEQREILSTAHNDYSKGLNITAFFKLNNHALGEDLVQETFLKTWSYLVTGGKIDVMRAFLYHVLNNLIVDQYRKRKTTSLDNLLEKGFDPGDDDSDSQVNILDGKAAILLIKNLPEIYEKVMRMRYIQNLTINEISLITKQTKNTVTVQLYRGLEKLKTLYYPTKN
jgi:RNA polymerase sigma-70 factor, ECF subfamily